MNIQKLTEMIINQKPYTVRPVGFVTEIPKQNVTFLPDMLKKYNKLDPKSNQARKLRRFFRNNGTTIKLLRKELK
jgi:hypothetical protein